MSVASAEAIPLQHQAVHRNIFGFHGVDGVLQDYGVAHYYVGLHLDQLADQSHGVANAGQPIHGVARGDDVEHLLALVNLGEGTPQQAVEHLGGYVVWGGLIVQNLRAVDAGNMGAADADVCVAGYRFAAEITLGFGESGLDRSSGLFDILNPAFLYAFGRNNAGAEDFQVALGSYPRKQDGHFRGAYIYGRIKLVSHCVTTFH